MFNPCYPFTPALLEGMLAKKVRYFLRATYKRGREYQDDMMKEAFIISHYHNLADAELHYKNIPFDPWRFLYDTMNPLHIALLREAARTKEYSIFSQFIMPGIEKKATQRFGKQTTLYLLRHLKWELGMRVSIR